jgi:hypothetical protein
MRYLLRIALIVSLVASFSLYFLPNDSTAEASGKCLADPNGPGCRAGLPALEYQRLLDEMLLYGQPDVQYLPTNEDELLRFSFHRLTNESGTPIYDAPNGNMTRSLDPGFNFVTVGRRVDGWVEINPGEWVRESDTSPQRPSEFSGVLLNPETAQNYEKAWVVYPVRPSVAPGYAENPEAPRLEKYTFVNIFKSVEINGWRWYLIGPDAWVKQIYVGKIVYTERPEGVKGRWFAIDLYEQVLVAYENDTPVFATLISSGLPEWSTNEGLFRTWARVRNGPMSGAEGRDDFYSLENVPWTLYFDGSIALHAAYWHDGFGYRRSHGCVNMSITDSHWVFRWSQEGGYDLPHVYVWASGEYR